MNHESIRQPAGTGFAVTENEATQAPEGTQADITRVNSNTKSGDAAPVRPSIAPDFDQAARFLTLLDETASRFTFQTFDDNKARKAPHLARVLHGTLEEHWQELCQFSAAGAGVFVTVNETNGKGRKVADIVRVRAVFQECDRPGTPEPPLQPHIVVESSPGK